MRVLTKEFFRYYESLGRDASELEDVRISLQRAKKEQDDVHSKLQCQQERLKSIRCSIEEEKKRIELTSSHWFYGTTTLQPQLWLRGGCKGKVERARKKIVKAQEEDIPNTAVEIETCQIQLPDLQKITKEKSDQFKVSSNATSERRAMKDQAVLEYPSINLSQLQQQESILGQKNAKVGKEEHTLEEVVSQLVATSIKYQSAKDQLKKASNHIDQLKNNESEYYNVPKPIDVLNRANQSNNPYTKTIHTNGETKTVIVHSKQSSPEDFFCLNRNGKILSTNFPCPGGCGFLVTWHQTHCCNACARTSTDEGDGDCNIRHGQQCGRTSLSTQKGAKEKWEAMKQKRQSYQSSLSKERNEIEKSFNKAREDSKQADRICAQALVSIPITVRETYFSVCNSLLRLDNSKSSSSSQFCGRNSKINMNNIREELLSVENSQARLSQQLGTVRQLLAQVQREGANTREQLKDTQILAKEEQDRIFDQLRNQVLESVLQGQTNLRELPTIFISNNEHQASRPFITHSNLPLAVPIEGEILVPNTTNPPAFAPHSGSILSAPIEEILVSNTINPPAFASHSSPILSAPTEEEILISNNINPPAFAPHSDPNLSAPTEEQLLISNVIDASADATRSIDIEELMIEIFDSTRYWPQDYLLDSKLGLVRLNCRAGNNSTRIGNSKVLTSLTCCVDLNPQHVSDHWIEVAFRPCGLLNSPGYRNPIFSQHGKECGWEIRVGKPSTDTNQKKVNYVEAVWTTNSEHNEFHNDCVPIENDEWCHVVLAYNSKTSTLTLYVNGQPSSKILDTNNTECFTKYSKYLPRIGQNSEWQGRKFKGMVAFASGNTNIPVAYHMMDTYVQSLSRSRLDDLRKSSKAMSESTIGGGLFSSVSSLLQL